MHFTALVLSVALSLPLYAEAEILEIESFANHSVRQAIQNSDPASTWIVFDIDNTLIRPTTMIGSHQWGDYLKAQRLALGDSPEGAHAFQHQSFSAAQRAVTTQITESSALELAELLSSKSFSYFALTARDTDIVDVTLKQVSNAGFNFESSFPSLARKDESVRKGVVFSGSTPKGVLLKRLIAKSLKKPSKIFFFDDRRYNLESVEKELAAAGIEFHGLRYSQQDAVMANFRADIANVQWLRFKETKKILSDEDTLSILFR